MTLAFNFRLQRPSGFALAAAGRIPAQSVTALFGASGSGKTTLLRCLAGLEQPAGTCRFRNRVWQDSRRFVPTHRRPVGYVFQHPSLFPHLSVRGNLEYGWRRVAPAQRRIAFNEAVRLLGLEPLLHRTCPELSGGERQRVAIARALLASPELLLMDEPLAALDQPAKTAILQDLTGLFVHLNLPVVYVSHHPDELVQLTERMLLLESGQIRASGETTTLLTRLDLPLACGDSAAAILTGQVAGYEPQFDLTRIDLADGHLNLPGRALAIGTAARLRVQARDVSLALRLHRDTSILNILPARVSELRDLDKAQLMVRLTLADGQPLLARVTQRSRALLDLHPGQHLYAQVKSVALI